MDEPTTYWILVEGFTNNNKGNFNLTLDGRRSNGALSLIDSAKDSVIQKLGSEISYRSLPLTLNIRAAFNPIVVTANSVRVTFDNPSRSFCEKKAPFSVFGDVNGDYWNATIPIGSHLVTATPYAAQNCVGTPGPPLNQTFVVSECDYSLNIYNVAQNRYNGTFGFGAVFESFPCQANIQFDPFCGFDIQQVQLVLVSNPSGKVLYQRTELSSPYFLYGDRNGAVLAGSISKGNYSIVSTVNGILAFPPVEFTVEGDCSL
jgi:hypothetical protein